MYSAKTGSLNRQEKITSTSWFAATSAKVKTYCYFVCNELTSISIVRYMDLPVIAAPKDCANKRTSA